MHDTYKGMGQVPKTPKAPSTVKKVPPVPGSMPKGSFRSSANGVASKGKTKAKQIVMKCGGMT